MPSIIIGTAGHIDHGKSALVRALTGTDPDRLPEEKKRGITIDLGFADLEVDGLQFGFVDVPGHERFVKNMLAGAHGIDVLALVIAADEGVMPQTREHLDICRLLGVQHGLVVITKRDLVDDDMLTLVTEEVRELIAGSFLENAAIISASSKTGVGLDELRKKLVEIARKVPQRSADLVTRLPIDRAFSMKGFGPVVTGTLLSGEIAEGDELKLLPADLKVRVRGAQVHGKSVGKALAGQRTALNLAGVEVSQLERGMILAPANTLRSTQIVDVSIQLLPTAPRPLRSRSRVRLHIGAAEVLGRVRSLDLSAEITAGGSAFAQLSFERPVIALHGDRIIIRSYSPAETIGGAVVLDPFAAKHRAREIVDVRRKLGRLMSPSRVDKFAALVEASATRGRKLEDVVAATGWKREVAAKVATEAAAAMVVIDANEVFVSPEAFDRLSKRVVTELENHHKREPLTRGMLRETLRDKVFANSLAELFLAVMRKLETGNLVVSEKDVVRAATHKVDLAEDDLRIKEKLERIYLDAGVEAPSLDDAMTQAGVATTARVQTRKILQLLIEDRTILRVQNEMFMHKTVINSLKEKLLTYASTHEPERLIDVAAFKDLAGVSRKYAIPLLEFFDRERVTRRAGDKRLILKP